MIWSRDMLDKAHWVDDSSEILLEWVCGLFHVNNSHQKLQYLPRLQGPIWKFCELREECCTRPRRPINSSYKKYTHTECTKHCTAFWPQFEQPQLVGAWTLHGVESIPQGCWPMLTPMLPTVLWSWLDVLWVVDHSWYKQETVVSVKPSSVAVLDTQTGVPGTYYHTLFKDT